MSWEDHKENIQPLRQGRNFETMMQALSLINDNKSRQKMLDDKREQFDKDIEEAKDDRSKQLDLWYAYIDWLEQMIPDGGKVSGLTNAIEECIEKYYNRNEFKQDLRLFDIFMKFKRFCDEPVEIFGFMYSNSIATLLTRFYLNWSWQYEMKKNTMRAEELLQLGLKNLASPRDVLEEAITQLRFRVARMFRDGDLDECPEMGPSSNREIQAELASGGIRAALQTLKFRVTKKKGLQVPVKRTGIAVDNTNVGGLKSQTRIVNGVRVAKKAPVKSKSTTSNRPIPVLPETNENGPVPTDENGPLPSVMKKLPTSQRIQMVGRTGAENFAPTRGVLSTTNKPPVLLE